MLPICSDDRQPVQLGEVDEVPQMSLVACTSKADPGLEGCRRGIGCGGGRRQVWVQVLPLQRTDGNALAIARLQVFPADASVEPDGIRDLADVGPLDRSRQASGCVVWCGVVWCGVVRCVVSGGVVWCGVGGCAWSRVGRDGWEGAGWGMGYVGSALAGGG